ncbi:MAG: ArdC-like ssDNA-binding domain-containing protein [Candidatus Falkowbacteria bacterium]
MTIESTWKGSAETLELVRKQIAQRWGEADAEAYDPKTNCFTFKQWKRNGYVVKKGEKGIRSYTFVEAKSKDKDKANEAEDGMKYRKTVWLFYQKQVEPLPEAE